MRKLITLIFLGLIISFTQPLNPDFDRPPRTKERAPRQLIETLRKVRLIEELNLTDEQSIKFFPKLNEIREAKEELNQNRKIMIDELMDLLEKDKKSSDQINVKLDKLFKLEEEFNKKETALKKEIRKILKPEQQARLILFQLRFDKEMREMIQGVKEMRQERIKQREKRWR